jgi:hypothetical protein
MRFFGFVNMCVCVFLLFCICSLPLPLLLFVFRFTSLLTLRCCYLLWCVTPRLTLLLLTMLCHTLPCVVVCVVCHLLPCVVATCCGASHSPCIVTTSFGSSPSPSAATTCYASRIHLVMLFALVRHPRLALPLLVAVPRLALSLLTMVLCLTLPLLVMVPCLVLPLLDVVLCYRCLLHGPSPFTIVVWCSSSPSLCIVVIHYGSLFLALHCCFIVPHLFQVFTSPSFVLLLFVMVHRSLPCVIACLLRWCIWFCFGLVFFVLTFDFFSFLVARLFFS